MIETVEHARDVVQDGLVELSDRLGNASLVTRRRKDRRRVTARALILVLVAGGIAAVVITWWLRRTSAEDIAPDPFGRAVEDERAAGVLQEATRF